MRRTGQTSRINSTVAEITCDSLWAKIQAGEELVIVDALPTISYAGAHLPGAINITPDRVDTLAERRIPDRDAQVVVYCAGLDCVSSVEVANRLAELGYTNVLHFAGGKQAWREAGLPLEGGRV
jgi:rhodanese-related sulfurtransferase